MQPKGWHSRSPDRRLEVWPWPWDRTICTARFKTFFILEARLQAIHSLFLKPHICQLPVPYCHAHVRPVFIPERSIVLKRKLNCGYKLGSASMLAISNILPVSCHRTADLSSRRTFAQPLPTHSVLHPWATEHKYKSSLCRCHSRIHHAPEHLRNQSKALKRMKVEVRKTSLSHRRSLYNVQMCCCF